MLFALYFDCNRHAFAILYNDAVMQIKQVITITNTECKRVLHGGTWFYTVLKAVKYSVIGCYKVSQKVIWCHLVLDGVRRCYTVLHGVAQYYMVLQSIKRSYMVLHPVILC